MTLFLRTSLLACLALPMSAMAANLNITNNTKFDVTTTINDKICSSSQPLGELGITHPGQTTHLTHEQVSAACILNESNCKADIHLSNDCTGPVIGTVYLYNNVLSPSSSHILGKTMYDAHYDVVANGLNIQLNTVPA